jgi:hypothetical protein
MAIAIYGKGPRIARLGLAAGVREARSLTRGIKSAFKNRSTAEALRVGDRALTSRKFSNSRTEGLVKRFWRQVEIGAPYRGKGVILKGVRGM